jgi:hypothetical protein
MNYSVPCDCGQTLLVRAGDAGATKLCACGQVVAIPSLSILRQSRVEEPTTAARKNKDVGAIVFCGILLTIGLLAVVLPGPHMLLAGFAMLLFSRLWFVGQIFAQMSPANALIVLLVPFMPTVFFVQNIRSTWRPFVFGLFGMYLMLSNLQFLKH